MAAASMSQISQMLHLHAAMHGNAEYTHNLYHTVMHDGMPTSIKKALEHHLCHNQHCSCSCSLTTQHQQTQ